MKNLHKKVEFVDYGGSFTGSGKRIEGTIIGENDSKKQYKIKAMNGEIYTIVKVYIDRILSGEIWNRENSRKISKMKIGDNLKLEYRNGLVVEGELTERTWDTKGIFVEKKQGGYFEKEQKEKELVSIKIKPRSGLDKSINCLSIGYFKAKLTIKT